MVTNQFNPSIILPTNKVSTLKLDTHKTPFNCIFEVNKILLVKVIGAFFPLDKIIGGKLEDNMFVNIRGVEVMIRHSTVNDPSTMWLSNR